jgi:hypothetical protein
VPKLQLNAALRERFAQNAKIAPATALSASSVRTKLLASSVATTLRPDLTKAAVAPQKNNLALKKNLELLKASRKKALAAQQLVDARNRELGKITGRFDALKSGPLKYKLAETFAGGRYQEVELQEDIVLYRAGISGKGKDFGEFFSRERPTSIAQVRVDKAILPEWRDGAKSPINAAFGIKIPKGTKIYIGKTGSQGGMHVGGTEQIIVPESWNIKGAEVQEIWPLK